MSVLFGGSKSGCGSKAGSLFKYHAACTGTHDTCLTLLVETRLEAAIFVAVLSSGNKKWF